MNGLAARIMVSVSLGLVLLPASATVVGATAPIGRVETAIRDEMAVQHIPGVAVAVIEKGKVVLSKGYGFANVEHDVPVRPDTVFQSGSVGKQFTATGIMCLVEDGRLSLDDPVSKYLPEAPPSWAPIRIHHLLTHTSGIPDYATDGFDLRGDYDDAKLVRLATQLALEFPAGSRWNYSNTGYALLGIIIDRVTGRHYSELLRQRIFAPLGMTSTRLIDEASIIRHRAAGYRLLNGELANQEWVSPTLNTTADGSLYLSLNDMIAWDAGLRRGQILRADSWRRIYTPVVLTSGNSYPYGYGWSVSVAHGQEIHEHGGSWQGFKTYIRRYMGDDVTVIVLANLGDADPRRFTDRVAGAMYPTLIDSPPRPVTDALPALAETLRHFLATAAAGSLTSSDLPHLSGGVTPDVAATYRNRLAALGPVKSISLIRRQQLGDDTDSDFLVTFESGQRTVNQVVDPNGKTVSVSTTANE